MNKTLIVCNPISGGGRGRKRGVQLEQRLRLAGREFESFVTERAGDARRRAATVEADVDRIVVIGGDGTLNEVLNGLRDPSRVPITQLATGTANLLAHDLRLPFRAEGMGRLLDDGSIRYVDMGQAGDRRFLLVVSAGFDAMVTHEAQRGRSGPSGYLSWIVPTIRTLRGYRPPNLEVKVDGGPSVRGELVIVSNVRNYGGIFTVADRASCDSGHLDVCVLKRASLPGLARAAFSGLTGGLSSSPGVVYLTGRRIELDADRPVPVELDGDPFGTTPVEIELTPRCVPVVVPAFPV
ncbi:MAG TPA: diacylglycerol kinase family protein [Candidatus Polarisedimenticolaceae bacterium]|nr:diacylglycerol kinase family protein [Candidatus Polarisedimenticolaceae bacterium]